MQVVTETLTDPSSINTCPWEDSDCAEQNMPGHDCATGINWSGVPARLAIVSRGEAFVSKSKPKSKVQDYPVETLTKSKLT
ncbi:hypothetical protein TWF569_009115 [Orbilia oligospora]|nr:hypothetical protein TWF569_009115 [Orbilia oligospora]